MKKVGFIGLGAMGKPMAKNLISAGYPLFVYDLSKEPLEELANDGALPAQSSKEVAEKSDVLITMLPDSPQVEEICKGEYGIFAGANKNLIFIDSSTTDPKSFVKLAEEANAYGIRCIDAPVGGGVTNAIAGNLIMLVGGEETLVELCRDIFETIGERVLHCGPLGSGKSLKLTNNLMTALYACLLVEGFSLAQKAGVNRKVLLELLKGNSPNLLNIITKRIMENDFNSGYKMALAQKDVKLALKLGAENNNPLPFGALAKEMFQFAMNQGLGEMDFSSVYKLYDE